MGDRFELALLISSSLLYEKGKEFYICGFEGPLDFDSVGASSFLLWSVGHSRRPAACWACIGLRVQGGEKKTWPCLVKVTPDRWSSN